MPGTTTGLLTLEEFAALPDDGRRLELVRGEVREMSPAHGPAGSVASILHGLLFAHVWPRQLGITFCDGTGFALLGAQHTNRPPDVAFIRAERVPPEGLAPGPVRTAPDIAAEVLSPSETAWILEDKLADYREAGTPLIWVVDPTSRRVTVHPNDAPSYTLREGDVLTGGSVLPGFRCEVTDLFSKIART